MSAIADVARIAGVSKSTASRALSGSGYVSDATRARVVHAAATIGYVASSNAASLVTGRTKNIGVVTPTINRWYFGEVLEGIEAALITAGYDLTLYRLTDDEEQRSKVFDYFLVRKRVDAVIAVGIALSSREVELLHSLRKPLVGIGGEVPGIATLSIDDVEAGRLATEHLIRLGHSSIMHLGGETDEQLHFSVHQQRLEGFRSALAAAGIVQDDDFRATVFSIPGGYEIALTLLADPRSRPTAIFAGCDEIAIGVIVAARQLGIQVPAQLSVVGIDDHDLAEMFGLTTIRQMPVDQGQLAVELLLGELSPAAVPVAPQRLHAPITLQVRSSTTAPPPDGA